MATKKRRLMPNLEELRRRAKSTLKEVEEAVIRLKESNLIDMQGQSSNSSPSEEHCILWLVSSFGPAGGVQTDFMLEHFAQGTNRTADIAIHKWILQFAFGGGEDTLVICALSILSSLFDTLKEVKTLLSFVQASCPLFLTP